MAAPRTLHFTHKLWLCCVIQWRRFHLQNIQTYQHPRARSHCVYQLLAAAVIVFLQTFCVSLPLISTLTCFWHRLHFYKIASVQHVSEFYPAIFAPACLCLSLSQCACAGWTTCTACNMLWGFTRIRGMFKYLIPLYCQTVFDSVWNWQCPRSSCECQICCSPGRLVLGRIMK